MYEAPDGSVVKASISRIFKCTVHYLEVMGSNPTQIELGVRSNDLQIMTAHFMSMRRLL